MAITLFSFSFDLIDRLDKGTVSAVTDPFAEETRDKRLFVADIPPAYSLLLNKYYSLDEHVSGAPN